MAARKAAAKEQGSGIVSSIPFTLLIGLSAHIESFDGRGVRLLFVYQPLLGLPCDTAVRRAVKEQLKVLCKTDILQTNETNALPRDV